MTSAIRELVRDARQTAILDAARDLFSRQGYHKTTVPEIAKAAGASVGLIYYHFDSKADILVAIAEELHAFSVAAVRSSSGITDPRERLDAAIRDLYSAFDRFSKVFVIFYKDISSFSSEERQRIFAREEDTVNHLVKLIQEGQRAGVFSTDAPNVPLLAANLVGLGHLWALKKTWYFASRLTLADYIETQLVYLHALLDAQGESGSAPTG